MISSEEHDRWEALINSESQFDDFGGFSATDDESERNAVAHNNGNISLFPGDGPSTSMSPTMKTNSNARGTMEQLVEKNIELTENLNTALRELHEMEERALYEKSKADETEKELMGLRENIG